MNNFFLFIDTEASGLPKKWYLPYTATGNWPSVLQVSWIIYEKEGKKIKEQNYFISDNDVEIEASALRIHGITKIFLQQHGIPRSEALAILSSDLKEYQPTVVGHFLELDYHILGAAYFKEAMANPMEDLPTFCIMTASKHLQHNPRCKYLRLGDLYELLFKTPLLNQHDAMADATATADCFFELVKKREIQSFDQPLIVFHKKERVPGFAGWVIAMLLFIFIALLINSYYG